MLASKKRSRDGVGLLSMGMSSDNSVTYLKEATSALEPYAIQTMTIGALVDLFIQGVLHFEPNGQRGIVIDREYCRALGITITQTNIGLPNIVLNYKDGIYYVCDGKQRLLAILSLGLGLLQESFPLCSPQSKKWHATLYANTTNQHVEHIMDILYAGIGKPGKPQSVNEAMENTFLTFRIDAHVYPNWPSKTIAVVSTLYLVKRISHTPQEILYQLDCYICDLVREYDVTIHRELSSITGGKIWNDNKNVFSDVLRGIGCNLVDFVPKATNYFGYGAFMDALIPFVSSQPDEAIIKNIRRALTMKFNGFMEHARSIETKFKKFTPDMIAVLAYLLYAKINPIEIMGVLMRMQTPRMDGDVMEKWYKESFKKKKNLQEIMHDIRTMQ
jgi:hypothetical protein